MPLAEFGRAFRACRATSPQGLVRAVAAWATAVAVAVVLAPGVSATETVPAGAATLPPPVVNEAVWQPAPQSTWQWQLQGRIDSKVDAQVFIVDLFDSRPGLISALKKKNRKLVCYISAGAWEAWRLDAKHFPQAVLGSDYEGWPNERWLDIRRIDILSPVLLARLDLCKAKGFHGVEADNVDGYTNKTGFPLTAEDQLQFNVWFANEARKRGLSIGLKNSPELVPQLLPYFDWALAESCFRYGWCAELKPFIDQGKAVFIAEYTGAKVKLGTVCREALALRFSLLLKKKELGAYRRDCGRRR